MSTTIEEVTEIRLNTLTEEIIGSAYAVSNALGCGFLERVYERAMEIELKSRGLDVKSQFPISVYYREEMVGDFYADMLVESVVLVELKAISSLTDIHKAQCLNYLKGTGLKICLLINFGNPRVEVKRLRK